MVQAQSMLPASIEGRVVDTDTGEPLHGAHVFLSNTKIGTVSNPAGRYQLQRIPPGSHKLVVSMIGYKNDPIEIIFVPGIKLTFELKLTPVVYEMEEIYAGNLDDRWERHLQRFERLFLGESALADSVKILNPEVLRFESRWWGRFTAEALAPLKIENRALGYNIIFYLDEFRHSGSNTRWTGDQFFNEMTPEDSDQADYWKKNRVEAFKGSLRHFFISLMANRMEEEGFILYSHNRNVHGNYQRNTFRTQPRQILKESNTEHFFYINFRGRLEIIYTGQEEDRRYVRWRRIHRSPSRVQTSYLNLNTYPITIDPNGKIVEIYGATRYGYHSFMRVADKTPLDYRPEDYRELTQIEILQD